MTDQNIDCIYVMSSRMPMVNNNDVIVMSDADAFVSASDLFAPITERHDKLMWLLQFNAIADFRMLPMAFTAAKIKILRYFSRILQKFY